MKKILLDKRFNIKLYIILNADDTVQGYEVRNVNDNVIGQWDGCDSFTYAVEQFFFSASIEFTGVTPNLVTKE